jgi:hypothetical protein
LVYVQEGLSALFSGMWKLFLNPLFYYLVFIAAVLGVSRVKRERRNFHVRVQDAYFELRQLFPLGIILGLSASILIITAGIVIPVGLVVLSVCFTFLLSLTTKVRLLSPSYVIGASFFTLIFAAGENLPIPFFAESFSSLDDHIFPSIAMLLSLLLVIEGILIIRNGSAATSPKLLKSKRGQWVGLHEAKRLWAVPMFLLIPGEGFSIPFDWWPLFTIGNETYSLLLVPFAIGFHHQVLSQLPKTALKKYGKRVLLLGVVAAITASVGYWIPFVSIVVVALTMIAREAITLKQRVWEENQPVYFSQKNQGVMILEILPNSPAEKMSLKVGELITKVNGTYVKNESDFYEALQRNRAHCKLEVIDVNGQVRFVGRALFEGEHHELGVLFVSNQEKWGNAAV